MKKIILFLTILIITMVSFTPIIFAVFKEYSLGGNKLSFVIKYQNTGDDNFSDGPRLMSDMIPVIWDTDSSKWKIVSATDSNWYNYTEKRWANAMMPDGKYDYSTPVGTLIDEDDLGSLFVWIPRYEYKISYNNVNDYTLGGSIDINLITKDVVYPTSGYTIHPAFTSGISTNYDNGQWDKEIDGFWVAKFEMSKEKKATTWIEDKISSDSEGNIIGDNVSTRMVSKPNRSAWSRITINNAYTASKQASYNIVNPSILNSHMLKNSEWGAVAYLAYSTFGANTQPNINNIIFSDKSTVTGYSSTTPSEGAFGGPINPERLYHTYYGVKASTTGNIYGVYDMNGGTNEYTAAHFTGSPKPLDTNVSNAKYYTVYEPGTISNVGKIGDATFETFRWDKNAAGSDSVAPAIYTSSMYFLRGGAVSNGGGSSKSGIFASYQLNSTILSNYRGFRTVLIIE